MQAENARSSRPPGGVIECGSLRFTQDRIETIIKGRRLTSFSRDGVRWIHLTRDSVSEAPLPEFLWAVGAGAGAFFLLRNYTAGKTTELVAGLVLGVISLALAAHLVRRTTVLVIKCDDGVVRVDLEAGVSTEDLKMLNTRLRDELGWPVKP